MRTTLSPQDWRAVAGMSGFIVFLHVVGFGLLLFFVVPARFDLGESGIYTVGIGVLAYTFGLRHAFDADHIAAVDNTTRKLLTDRADGDRRPLSVGSGSPSVTRRSCSCSPSCSRSA